MNDLVGTLARLAEASLLRRVLSDSEVAYKFRHSLDQQTAYHSLLRKDREKLHKVVGLVMEREPAAELESRAQVLAEHFSVGGDEARAMKYFRLAGDEAARVYANAEALSFYRRALSAARALGSDSEVLRDLYLRCGRTLELSGDYPAAMENYRELERVGQKASDVGLELAALTRQTTLLVAPSAVSDPKAGEAMARRCVELAKESGDREAEARGHWSLLLAAIYDGRLDEARQEGETALKLADTFESTELKAYIANDLSSPYLINGDPDRAWELLDTAIEIWRQLGNQPMLVDSLGNLSSGLIYVGEYDKALEISANAHAIANQIGNRWAQAFSLFLTEQVHADRGDFAQALAISQEEISLGAEAGFLIPAVYSNAFRASLFAYMGAFDRALEAISSSEEAGARLGMIWDILPSCMRILVSVKMGKVAQADRIASRQEVDPDILATLMSSPAGPQMALAWTENDLANERIPEGLDRIQQVIDREHSGSFHVFLPDALELAARLHRAAGDFSLAYAMLDEAQAEVELLDARRMDWVIHAQRAVWLDEDGHPEAAAEERRLARPSFDYVAEHIGDEDLRRTFVSSTWVHGLKMG